MMIETWEIAFNMTIRMLAIWVLWELGKAIRSTLRPPMVRELEVVKGRLDKVRTMFDGIEAKLSAVVSEVNPQKEFNEEEELH